MKKMMFFIIFIVLTLSGCKGGTYSPNCAADGPNCKQHNPKLDPDPRPPNPAVAPNCASDGSDCKQLVE